MEYEMRAADCKYSELRTSRCQGDASLHHNHREDEDEDQEAMETVRIQGTEGDAVARVWPPLLKLLRLLKIGMF